MEIKLVTETISEEELMDLARSWYGDMIKGVVDIEREVLALGGEYHMDANAILMENGSKTGRRLGF